MIRLGLLLALISYGAAALAAAMSQSAEARHLALPPGWGKRAALSRAAETASNAPYASEHEQVSEASLDD